MAVEWALLLGCIAIGFLFLVPPADFFRESMKGWLNAECLSLAATVYLITVLGEFMHRCGLMNRMMKALEDLTRDGRYVAAISAALIGLMPMPGGALLSAPMVDTVGTPIGVARDRMAAINYWFRHVWEFVWPLYPGVLLASSLLSINITTLALAQIPLSIASIIGGLIFLIWPIARPEYKNEIQKASVSFREIFLALWPVLVVIVLTMIPWPQADAVGLNARVVTRFKLLSSLLLSTIAFGYINRIDRKTVKDVVIVCLKKHTIMVIFAIMIFSNLIEYTKAAVDIAPFFKSLGVPPLLLICLVNFIVGLLTGITQAYVGICFPIIAPLMYHDGNLNLALMQFAYMSGFIGIMLTPVHLCFTLTKEYFCVDWGKIYRLVVLPVIFLFIASLIIALIGFPKFG
jgi:uncharacterized protein